MLLPHFSALGAGPLVLMLHGAAGGFRSFAPQVERYAWEGFRAVAWDMPGYGLSTPVEPFGVRGLAQSCIQLIEALLPPEAQGPARSVALIGHGLGGMVAQEVVMRRPDLIHRLVLPLQAQAGFDRDAALSHIHVPTLLLAGEYDRRASGPVIERMAGKIQGSRWVQMPGVGHWLQLEAPDAFDALVLDFLREPVSWRLH